MPGPVLLLHAFVVLICALLHKVDEPANHLPQTQVHTWGPLQIFKLIDETVVDQVKNSWHRIVARGRGFRDTPVHRLADYRRFASVTGGYQSSCLRWPTRPCPINTRAAGCSKFLGYRGWLVRRLWLCASFAVPWFWRNTFFESSRKSLEHRSVFRIFEIEFPYVAVKMTWLSLRDFSFRSGIAGLLFGPTSNHHFVEGLLRCRWCLCCRRGLAWDAFV